MKTKRSPIRISPTAIRVNRHLFMAWTEGVILDRDRKGNCLVTDHLDGKFTAAEKAMDRGETIYLTDDDGKVVTRMRVEGDGYVESGVV
jgi:hypothetical protein